MSNEVIEIESIPTKIRYKGIIWIPETNNKKVVNTKQDYFSKWIDNTKHVGDVFTLDDFYSEYPKHRTDVKCKQRLVKTISRLVKDGKIDQWKHKDEFKVLK